MGAALRPAGVLSPAGRWSLGGALCGTLCLALGLPAAARSPVDPPSVRYMPERLGWSEVEMKARRLALAINSRVAVERLSPTAAAAALIPFGPVAGGLEPLAARAPTWRLALESAGLGRRSSTAVWFDPTTGAALQRRQVETGVGQNRAKTYRFGHDGVFSHRRKPRPGEASLPADLWGDVVEAFDTYASQGTPAADPSTLLYLIAAAPLDRPGDHVAVPIYTRNRVMLAELLVRGLARLDVDYLESSATGSRRVRTAVDALRIAVSGRLLEATGDEDKDLVFLGLHGDVEVFLDPVARLPLELAGRLQLVGRTRVRLARVVLASP